MIVNHLIRDLEKLDEADNDYIFKPETYSDTIPQAAINLVEVHLDRVVTDLYNDLI